MLATRKRRIANKKWWTSTRNCTCIATMSTTSVLVCVCVFACVLQGSIEAWHLCIQGWGTAGTGGSFSTWKWTRFISACLHINSPAAWRFCFESDTHSERWCCIRVKRDGEERKSGPNWMITKGWQPWEKQNIPSHGCGEIALCWTLKELFPRTFNVRSSKYIPIIGSGLAKRSTFYFVSCEYCQHQQYFLGFCLRQKASKSAGLIFSRQLALCICKHSAHPFDSIYSTTFFFFKGIEVDTGRGIMEQNEPF